jgi:hypothetical protein
VLLCTKHFILLNNDYTCIDWYLQTFHNNSDSCYFDTVEWTDVPSFSGFLKYSAQKNVLENHMSNTYCVVFLFRFSSSCCQFLWVVLFGCPFGSLYHRYAVEVDTQITTLRMWVISVSHQPIFSKIRYLLSLFLFPAILHWRSNAIVHHKISVSYSTLVISMNAVIYLFCVNI